MAIPSYTGKSLSSQEQGDYADIYDDLVGVFQTSVGGVQNMFLELRYILSNYKSNYPLAVREDGSINYDYLPDSVKKDLEPAVASGLAIYGMPLDWPAYYGWVNGRPVLAWGSYAVPYLYGENYINPYPGPELVLVDYAPFMFPDKETGTCPMGKTVTVVTFIATFRMRDGTESRESNTIAFGPICEWTTVTLGVEDASIPEGATSIRYYKFFPILEAVLDTSIIRDEDLSEMSPEKYWVAFPEFFPYDIKSTGAFRLLQEVWIDGSE